MKHRTAAPIPEPILQLQRQLEQFRSMQSRRAKLPESLWQGAVDLARQYGVFSVAHPLRLDYTRLKKRLGSPVLRGNKPPASFVELVGPGSPPPGECVIELESSMGSKMRIQWKTSAPPDWVNLLRAWRDAER